MYMPGILVSGGQTTVANLFYNMARKQVGLVGLWDCVAFDEVAGINFKDKDGIQIMKDYIADSTGAEKVIGSHGIQTTDCIQADYIFLQNAGNYVFPSDHCAMMGSCLYLDGIYDPAEIQGDFYSATSMSYQIYLPSDATMEQSETLDKYLISIGYRDLAWIGSAKDFMPEDTLGFEMQGNNITGYTGESKKLTIPNYVLLTDGTFWYTTNVYGIADEASSTPPIPRSE